MKVLIVEDQEILRESLALAIDNQPDMKICGQLSDAVDALAFAQEHAPDIVLMDVCTEGDSSGIVAAGRIKEQLPQIRVVIMTGMPDVTFVRKAREAGAESFIYKNVGTQELLDVLRSTIQGKSTYPSQNEAEAGFVHLSDDELAILRLVCETKSRKEIAQELYMSEGTVKRRISEILAKTGYDSILKLAVHAVSNGYVVPRY